MQCSLKMRSCRRRRFDVSQRRGPAGGGLRRAYIWGVKELISPSKKGLYSSTCLAHWQCLQGEGLCEAGEEVAGLLVGGGGEAHEDFGGVCAAVSLVAAG